jgi:hypothetical protein
LPQEGPTVALGSERNAAHFIFNHQSNVHYEFAPEGQTINKDVYLEVLRCLRDAVQRT